MISIVLFQPVIYFITGKANIIFGSNFRIKYKNSKRHFQNKKSHPPQADSFFVTPTIQFSNQLLKSFKKMYELKAIIPVEMVQPCGC